MFRRAQDRIRGYYYKTKDDLKNRRLPRKKLDTLLVQLQEMLKKHHFFGCYFDRRCATFVNEPIATKTTTTTSLEKKSICDAYGKFLCEGYWNKANCLYDVNHAINPYKSREARIIFQTWNLDHVIERSRAIIPAICDALSSNDYDNNKIKRRTLDVDKIFNDLFTLNNLKFVHIVCHDKGTHNNKAGPYLI